MTAAVTAGCISTCAQRAGIIRSQYGSRGESGQVTVLLCQECGAGFQGLRALGPTLAVSAEFAEPDATSSLPSLVLPRLMAPWLVSGWNTPAWSWLHFGSSRDSKGCSALKIVEIRLNIIINTFVVILINNSINSVLLKPQFLFSSDSSNSPSSPLCCWFPRLLAGSSESFLSRAMTGFLWQVVFWLKMSVIQHTLPPSRQPGKCLCCVRV